MLGLAKIVDRGPLVAASFAAGLFVFGMTLQQVVPAASIFSLLVYILSTSVVCFVVLRRGESAIAHVLLLALLALFIVSIALLKAGLILPISALIFWSAGLVAAIVLRRTVDLATSTLAAAGCGLLAFVAVAVFAPNLATQWQEVVTTVLDGMPAEDKARFSEGQLTAMTEGFSGMLPAAIAASVMLVAVCSVYIARWWQASIVNPGGFQKEFHSLRYGKFIAIGGLVLIAIAISIGGVNANALATLVMVCFFIQGLSVVHALIKQRGMSQGWLVGIYMSLILPQTVLLLGALGLSDNLYSLRKSAE